MLIGHPPLGYLIGVSLRRRFGTATSPVVASMAGSVAPDIDMLRFWFIDFGAYNHRYYFTHWPFFWLVCAAVILPLLYKWRRGWLLPAVGFFIGVLSHLVTDTVMGPVRWLAPFDNTAYELFRIPANYSHWVLSAIGYWTFLLDIGVCLLAALVWWRERQIPPYQSYPLSSQ